jgi:hypothetical protein
VRRLYWSGWYIAAGWLLTMPHSVAQRRGVGGVVPGHDSQTRSGVDSPLTWMPTDVSALNASDEEQVRRQRARDPLKRDGNSLEGALDSRSRWGFAREGVSSPRARRSSALGDVRLLSEAKPH